MKESPIKRSRKAEEIMADKNFIVPLFLRGFTAYDILKELQPLRPYIVTSVMVYNDIRSIVTAWHKERMHLIDKHLAMELAKIDALEKVYFEAWEQSTGAKKRTTLRKTGKAKRALDQGAPPVPDSIETDKMYSETQTTESVGDPRWLQGVQWCIDKRIALLGLGKSKASNKNGDEDYEEPQSVKIITRKVVFKVRAIGPAHNENITEAEVIPD